MRILHDREQSATLHDVTDSATASASGSPRARAITRAAQELVAERGWTHVTVDDIAARVGISRRTFFNHVDSKESAVLGTLPQLTEAFVDQLHGPAEDDLLGHIVRVAAAAASAQGAGIEDWRRLHHVLVANPDLIPRFKERVETLFAELVGHISSRPDVDEQQARVVVTAAAAVFQLSVEDALDRPGLGAFAARIETNLALLRDAAGPRA